MPEMSKVETGIRKRHEESLEANRNGVIGGVREQFDIASLLYIIDNLRDVEYEYAAMRIRNHDRARMADPNLHDDRHWSDDEEDVTEFVRVLNKAALEGQYYSFVVAKRVKAGEIEF